MNSQSQQEGIEGNVGTSKSTSSNKGRGPSKGLHSSIPMCLEFNEFDLPTGEWEAAYGTQIGLCAKRIDINVKEYPKMNKEDKDKHWEETKRKFHIDDPSGTKEKKFHSAVAARFRSHKSKLVARHITKDKPYPPNSPKVDMKPWEIYEGFFTKDQWEEFEIYCNSDEFKVKSEKGKENAKLNKCRHHLGQKSYGRARKSWIAQKRLPAIPAPSESSTSNTQQSSSTVNSYLTSRASEWVLAHEKRMSDGTWAVDPNDAETSRIVKLVKEYQEQEAREQAEGAIAPSQRGVDALTKAFGKKDHRGYVKGLGGCGVGVGYLKAFGPTTKKDKSACTSEELQAIREEFEARLEEKVEEKLQERLDARVEERVQQYLSSIIPGFTPTSGHHSPLPNFSTHHSPPHQSPPHPSPLHPLLEVPTKCHLAVMDEVNDNLVIVADGTAQPCPQGVIHNRKMKPGHYRVSVDTPYPEFSSVDLPVDTDDGVTKLGDVKGYFVEWPATFVIFDSQVSPSPNKKAKVKEQVGSCGFKSGESTTKFSYDNGLVSQDLAGGLTEHCKLLYYCMASDNSYDTTTITVEAPLFYLRKDTTLKILVTSQDVYKFLKREWVNVSLMHVYTLYLFLERISLLGSTEIKFLSPQRISLDACKDWPEVQLYVKSAFDEFKKSPCKFILAPYFEDGHWVLLAIDLSISLVYEFDPAMQPMDKPRNLELSKIMKLPYEMYRSQLKGNAFKKSLNSLVYKRIECAQQTTDSDSGYYVMRYMLEIVSSYRECKGQLNEEYLSRTMAYNDEELDEVREQWARFFRTTYLLNN